MIHTGLGFHLQENQGHHYSQEALENRVLLVSRYSRLHLVFPWVQAVLGGPAEPTLNHKGQNTVRATTAIFQTDGWTYRNAVISGKARHAGHSLWSKMNRKLNNRTHKNGANFNHQTEKRKYFTTLPLGPLMPPWPPSPFCPFGPWMPGSPGLPGGPWGPGKPGGPAWPWDQKRVGEKKWVHQVEVVQQSTKLSGYMLQSAASFIRNY